MKNILLILLFLSSLSLYAQENQDSKEYLLEASEHWRKELIPFPLDFAPSLTYKGVEDIRFSKGWADENSEEFWSYKFLWYLDEDPDLSEEKLQNDFEVYFDGIMGVVAKGNNIPVDSVVETTALFLSLNDGSYKGKVRVFDSFFLKSTIVLNFKVTSFYCEKRKKHLVYFDISPKQSDHRIWKEMSDIKITGPCRQN